MGHIVWPRRIALGALILLAGCVPAQQADVPTEPLGPGDTHEVEIHANAAWQATGIHVEAGETYDIRAEGRWSMGPICGVSDPNGVGHNTLFCTGTKPVPGHPTATLVGRVGPTGQPFVVGSALTLTPDDSGPLLMGVNADAMYFDNTGFLTVSIDRASPEPPPAPPGRRRPGGPGQKRHRDPVSPCFRGSGVSRGAATS